MNKKLWTLIFVFSALRLLVANSADLGVDEAHYVLYGLYPDLSYFDHPPLVGWIQTVFAYLANEGLGNWRLLPRLPAVAAGALSTLLIYRWLRVKGFQQSQAYWGVIALNLCLLHEGLSIFFLPDSLFLVLVPILVLTVDRLENSKNLQNWLLLGFILGLSGLSKYTAFLFVLALAIRWILKKSWRDISTFAFWSGVAVAASLILPVLIWNQRHDWMSFKYQSGHVLSWRNFSLEGIVLSQLSQFVLLGFFYPWLLKSLFTSFLDKTAWSFERILIFLCLGFMSVTAAFGNFLPHWTAPAYILGIPWAVATALQKGFFTRPLKLSFVGAISLFLVVNSEMLFHWMPKEQRQIFYRDIQGWPNFIEQVTNEAQSQGKDLAITNWTLGSRFMLYSPLRKNIFVLDSRRDQFDLWNPTSPIHKNFLILVETKFAESFRKKTHCTRLQTLGPRPFEWRGTELLSFEALICDDFSWSSTN